MTAVWSTVDDSKSIANGTLLSMSHFVMNVAVSNSSSFLRPMVNPTTEVFVGSVDVISGSEIQTFLLIIVSPSQHQFEIAPNLVVGGFRLGRRESVLFRQQNRRR